MNPPITTLSPDQTKDLINRLLDHVTAEVSSIDMEARFRDALDECYSFDAIGGPFAHMLPSRVLEEMDPIAFRCGVADQDTEDMFDIRNDYYDSQAIESARDDFVAELERELRDAQNELAAEEADPDVSSGRLTNSLAKVAELEAQIEATTNYSF